FFSSRRRHTRFSRDWSSDVCSSDLGNSKPPIHQLLDFIEADREGFVERLALGIALSPRSGSLLSRRNPPLLERRIMRGPVRHGRSEERRVGKQSRFLRY